MEVESVIARRNARALEVILDAENEQRRQLIIEAELGAADYARSLASVRPRRIPAENVIGCEGAADIDANVGAGPRKRWRRRRREKRSAFVGRDIRGLRSAGAGADSYDQSGKRLAGSH